MAPNQRLCQNVPACCICGAKPRLHSLYCPRCAKLAYGGRNDGMGARKKALQQAWNKERQCFVCYYTGAMLEMVDRHSPWYRCFDHRTPGNAKDLVLTTRAINALKSGLTDKEFMAILKEMVRHWEEMTPFDVNVVEFKYWHRNTRPSRYDEVAPGKISRAGISHDGICVVCAGKAAPHHQTCARCLKFVTKSHEKTARRMALKGAWSAEKGGFICAYTGVTLNDTDRRSPWYVSFDHKTPKKKGDLQVVAYFINIMKAELSDEEFRAFVKEMVKHWTEGSQFNRDIISFKYWHR